MPRSTLKVKLIEHTPAPEQMVALGARLCYSPLDLDTLSERIAQKEQDAFISGIVDSGHLSVMEHVSFTFAVEGVSRTLLAQLTRHRIASFSVQSQRYVSMQEGFGYIVPPSIEALGEDAVREYEAQMETMQGWYEGWQARLGGKGEKTNQDARFVLPGACETRLIFTMNARELLHFFALRCCERAQWEIRAMADACLALAYPVAPAIFAGAGPACLTGVCPEGKRSCGGMEAVRAKYSDLKKRG